MRAPRPGSPVAYTGHRYDTSVPEAQALAAAAASTHDHGSEVAAVESRSDVHCSGISWIRPAAFGAFLTVARGASPASRRCVRLDTGRRSTSPAARGEPGAARRSIGRDRRSPAPWWRRPRERCAPAFDRWLGEGCRVLGRAGTATEDGGRVQTQGNRVGAHHGKRSRCRMMRFARPA